jgi:hypothetical protein
MALERQKAVHAAQLEMMKEQAKQALIQRYSSKLNCLYLNLT